MTRLPHSLKTFLLLTILFQSYSVNAENWCVSTPDSFTVSFTGCAPSAEVIAKPFCSAWANNVAGSSYRVTSQSVLPDAIPYTPEPPLVASNYSFGCKSTAESIPPLATTPLSTAVAGFNAIRQNNVFNESKSTEYKGCSDPKVNSVRISTGENLHTEIDYQSILPSRIEFIRYFSSHDGSSSPFATGWSHNYEKKLSFVTDSFGVTIATALRLRGKLLHYTKSSTDIWTAENDVLERLTSFPDHYEIALPDDTRELYNLGGQLTSIVYINGYQIDFVYDANDLLITIRDSIDVNLTIIYDSINRIESVYSPDGRGFGFGYKEGFLGRVSYADGTSKQYLYDDLNQPNMLSGIIDESGTRFHTWKYDASNRVESYGFGMTSPKIETLYSYNVDRTRTVTNSLNQPTNYIFSSVSGGGQLILSSGIGYSECDKGDPSYTYYALNGNLLTKSAYGVTTEYSNYDEKHNAQVVTKGVGTLELQTTTYAYDINFYQRISSKTTIADSPLSGNIITSYTYDSFGNITKETTVGVGVNYTITSLYNGPLNQLSLIDGPRLDVQDITRLNYYPNIPLEGNNRARLRDVDNALGIVIRGNIQYTATGKISNESRPNGLEIINEYYIGNDRLKSYSESASAKFRKVFYQYTETGEILSVSIDGSSYPVNVNFYYDNERRLIGESDSLNNGQYFIVNSEGNVISRDIYGSSNPGIQDPIQTIQQTFESLKGKLKSQTEDTVTTNYMYDNRGLLLVAMKGVNLQNEQIDTYYLYDGLNRLINADIFNTSNFNLYKSLKLKYGLGDNLLSVTDSNYNITEYIYSGLGKIIDRRNSVGNSYFAYDESGNLSDQTLNPSFNDQDLHYTYDALNRIISITGVNSPGIVITYDNCFGGVGRLCSITDASGLTAYSYDGFGRVTSQVHTELGVSYTTQYFYNSLGKLLGTSYPSQLGVNNFYNSIGQVDAVDIYSIGAISVIIDGATYTADGKLRGFTYGNGYTENRTFDAMGNLLSQSMPLKPVVDKTAPIITPPANKTVEASDILTPVILGIATALDDIDGVVVATANNVGPFPLGLTTVTWTAVDAAGNSSSVTQTINVIDTTTPIIIAPDSIWIISDVALNVDLGIPTASDIFIPVVVINDAPAIFPIGVTTVTWTAIDANGNSNTVIQTVTITTVEAAGSDSILPTVTAPTDLTIEATAEKTPVMLGEATALDNVDGVISATPDQSSPFEIGTYTILWTATDSNGNDGTDIQNLVVQDTTAPIITAPADITVISDVAIEIDLGLVSATDLFLDDVINDAPNPFPVGTTIVTWTASDISQNTATATQVVTVTPLALYNAINNSREIKSASLIQQKSSSDELTKHSFKINPDHQSTIVLSMITDDFGKTLPATASYRATKHGRWKNVDIAQISSLVPDVMMIISDNNIDLWQLNTKTKEFDHQKHMFNGKEWATSQALKNVNHTIWNPSQPNPALRPEVTWSYNYDNQGNIIQSSTDLYEYKTYSYDALNRLIEDFSNGKSYRYDNNDNRLSITENGITINLSYLFGTNILSTNGAVNIQSDSQGNSLNDTLHNYGYDDFNQLTRVDSNIHYVYNAFGLRSRKVTPTSTTVYHYNIAGQLISETDENGVAIKDYIYLDKLPLAVVTWSAGISSIAYIHTDNLYTPRRVTDSTGKVIWAWDSDSFGDSVADSDPDGDGDNFDLNLRFTGQYFDNETGLHSSSNGYYDPSIGRYITSNNRGINGELNKFVYLAGNPLKRPDIYCLRNQHENRNFDIYNDVINHVNFKNDSTSVLFEGVIDLSITNSITSLFEDPSNNCNKTSDNLSDTVLQNNIDNVFKINVNGIGIITNK